MIFQKKDWSSVLDDFFAKPGKLNRILQLSTQEILFSAQTQERQTLEEWIWSDAPVLLSDPPAEYSIIPI